MIHMERNITVLLAPQIFVFLDTDAAATFRNQAQIYYNTRECHSASLDVVRNKF